MRPRRARLGLLAVTLVALWEAALALRAPHMVPRPQDWHAAAAAVRAGFAAGDLLVVAPAWADPLLRQELGDLMPESMVGRPDAAAYRRIWELSIRGEHAGEVRGLRPELVEDHGRVRLSRYAQPAVQVSYDLVEHFPEARVAQAPRDAPPDAAGFPCMADGGAFYCGHTRIERRMMEIDYRPRYGVVVPVDPGRRTILSFSVPPAAMTGADLLVWCGLHDYYARKTDSGPVDVTIVQDKVRVPMKVYPDRGWQRVSVRPDGAAAELRIEVSAGNANNRLLGFAAQVRR